MTRKLFSSKCRELKKVLNQYRVYDFKFTSPNRLVISQPHGVYTSVVINHILTMFTIDSDVEMSFFHGNIVLYRY